MACPQGVDGDDLQIQMVAADILNKQSPTADKGWSSTLGIRHGANNLSVYKRNWFIQNIAQGLRLGQVLRMT